MLHHSCFRGNPQTKGDKIRIGCLTPAFLGAQKWAEMLHHPCIVGGPQQRGQNQSTKKTTTIKPKEIFSTASLTLPGVLLIAPTGD